MSTPNPDFVAPPMVKIDLSPEEAWQPLPDKEWNEAAARHLLRRAGWAAQPDEVQRVLHDGLPKTLERFFPEKPVSLAQPRLIADLAEESPDFLKKIQGSPPEEKIIIQREVRERSRMAVGDLSIKW